MQKSAKFKHTFQASVAESLITDAWRPKVDVAMLPAVPQNDGMRICKAIVMHPETKHSSAEDEPRNNTGPHNRQNGETGTDRVTKDTVRNRERVSSGANFIFTFCDAMG
jgi:hypothetical protein